MSFPIPQGRQREVVVLPEYGHAVVLGTAGSGKTTMALLRANYLAELSQDGTDRVLLVTFNGLLTAFRKMDIRFTPWEEFRISKCPWMLLFRVGVSF